MSEELNLEDWLRKYRLITRHDPHPECDARTYAPWQATDGYKYRYGTDEHSACVALAKAKGVSPPLISLEQQQAARIAQLESQLAPWQQAAETCENQKARIAELEAQFEQARQWNNLVELELSNLRSISSDDDRDIAVLKTQLRLCEEHAATMAKDFDESLVVVQEDRDTLRARVKELEAQVDHLQLELGHAESAAKDLRRLSHIDSTEMRKLCSDRDATVKQLLTVQSAAKEMAEVLEEFRSVPDMLGCFCKSGFICSACKSKKAMREALAKFKSIQ